MTGINIINVTYRGAAVALTDVIAGRIPVMFDNLPGSIGHIRSGELRALGVTAAKRVPALPEIPAIAETVPGYEASVWYGIAAPKGTSPGIVEKLNQAVNSALTDRKVQARLAELGGEPSADDSGRVRKTDDRRGRQVEQGDPGCRHQDRVMDHSQCPLCRKTGHCPPVGGRISSVQMLLHRTCEDCSAECASLSLRDLVSGVSQPSFWLLSNISTARLTKSCMLRFAFAGYSSAM